MNIIRSVASTIKNNKTFTIPGENISVINGKIFVDGEEYCEIGRLEKDCAMQNVAIEGNVKSIDCGESINILNK